MKTILALCLPTLLVMAADYFNLWEWIFGFVIYGGLMMCVIMPFADMFTNHRE